MRHSFEQTILLLIVIFQLLRSKSEPLEIFRANFFACSITLNGVWMPWRVQFILHVYTFHIYTLHCKWRNCSLNEQCSINYIVFFTVYCLFVCSSVRVEEKFIFAKRNLVDTMGDTTRNVSSDSSDLSDCWNIVGSMVKNAIANRTWQICSNKYECLEQNTKQYLSLNLISQHEFTGRRNEIGTPNFPIKNPLSLIRKNIVWVSVCVQCVIVTCEYRSKNAQYNATIWDGFCSPLAE